MPHLQLRAKDVWSIASVWAMGKAGKAVERIALPCGGAQIGSPLAGATRVPGLLKALRVHPHNFDYEVGSRVQLVLDGLYLALHPMFDNSSAFHNV